MIANGGKIKRVTLQTRQALLYLTLQQNKPVTMGVIATKSIIVVINMLLYL